MRISILALLVFFGLFVFQPAFAIYPFGGRIVARFSSDFCNHDVIVVVGPRGGLFSLRGFTQWVAGLALPVRWTIGNADHPPPCADVLIGGSSASISLLLSPNQLSFVNHASTPQWQ